MKISGLFPTTLKSRMTSVVALLVLGVTMLVPLVALVLAERDMKAVIGDQQYALLSSAATFIDDRLAAKKQLMATIAAEMPEAARTDPRALQAYLASRPGIADEFSNLVALDRNGKLVAIQLASQAGDSLSGAGKPYFEQTIATRKGLISEPFRGSLSGGPMVLVTQPVLDEKGAVALVLAAGIDLKTAAFLRQIASLKPGKSGFIFIMTTDGILVEHPAKARLLQHINATPGVNLGTEKALAGFEGWTEALNKEGRSGIYSYKRLKSTDWIVGARFPSDEAFGPIIALRQHSVLAAAVFAALAGMLAWLAIRHLLAPLESLRRNIAEIRGKRAGIGVLHTTGDDEIGELGRAFHELMAERETAQDAITASAKRARVIADGLPALIAYVDSEERFQFTNAHFKNLLGIDPVSMIGRPLRAVFGEAAYARLQPHIAAALRGERQHFEHAGVDRPGYYMTDYIPDLADDGSVSGVYILVLDISERRHAELTQARSETRLKLITDNLPVLIAYLDPGHHFRFGNATFERWFGMAPAVLLSRHLREVIGAEAYALACPHLERAFRGEPVTYETRTRIDRQWRILETTYIPDVQSDGSVAGVYALTHDMTRMKDVEAKLMDLARLDPLTGIPNRRMFGESLPVALERARRHGSGLALAYLDIDHFKRINDTCGHAVGDEVLKEFSRRLMDQVRQTDTVARMSGDEFVIIFENSGDAYDVGKLTEKIIEAVHVPFLTSRGRLNVTTSVGIALFGGEGQTEEALLANADHALYAAKHQGRDRFCVHAV